MAKNDYMTGRNEGMLYAYNYAKEHGLDALENEVRLRNLTNIPTQVSRKAIDECVMKIKNNTCDTFVILMASVLHDEFGFGEKRVQRALDRFMLKSECVVDDYVTWQDMIENIKEELNIQLNIRMNDEDVRC